MNGSVNSACVQHLALSLSRSAGIYEGTQTAANEISILTRVYCFQSVTTQQRKFANLVYTIPAILFCPPWTKTLLSVYPLYKTVIKQPLSGNGVMENNRKPLIFDK